MKKEMEKKFDRATQYEHGERADAEPVICVKYVVGNCRIGRCSEFWKMLHRSAIAWISFHLVTVLKNK